MPEAYKSYKDYLDNYKLASYTPLLSPTGGMKISAEGLAKYMMMHIQGGRNNNSRIITKKSEKLIRRVVTPESGYALSFREYKGLVSGETLCGQTGGAYGLFSAMIFQPEKSMVLLLLLMVVFRNPRMVIKIFTRE